ncbi:MAG: CBS domain-containing protein [Deltaproteobacteria bacterium]|nr:MAG: CBS domain-containing protein [Deltaproteobacteria bacterium]
MNHDLKFAHEDWTIHELAEFLIDNSISGAPVINEEGRVVGVVSLADIARYNALSVREVPPPEPHEFYVQTLERTFGKDERSGFHIDYEDETVTVRELMTAAFFHVSEETPVQQVADTLIKGRIHRIFVTRAEQVVGIITAHDLLKIVRDMPD